MLTGDNGILIQAGEAKDRTNEAQIEEQIKSNRKKINTSIGVREFNGLTDEERALLPEGVSEIKFDNILNENLKDEKKFKAVITGEVPIPLNATYKEGKLHTGVVIEYKNSEFVWVPVTQINKMVMCDKHTSGDCEITINEEGTRLECRTEAHKVDGHYNTEIVGRLYAKLSGNNYGEIFDGNVTAKTYGNHSGSLKGTGTKSTDKMNNIYDLEGTLREWTLEACNISVRYSRGTSYSEQGSPCYRGHGSPDDASYATSRLTLYIK